MIRIAVCNHGKTGGVEFHRLTQPLNKLGELYQGEAKVTLFRYIEHISPEFLADKDVVIVSRYLLAYMPKDKNSLAIAWENFKKIKAAGCKLIVDMDDSWQLSDRHLLRKMWEQNQIAEHMTMAMQLADQVWTTTPILADKIRPLNANVRVMKNALDPDADQWQPMPSTAPRVRIGWSGSRSHVDDIPLLAAPIEYLRLNSDYKRRFDMHYYGFQPGDPTCIKFYDIFSVRRKWKKYTRVDVATKVDKYGLAYRHADAMLVPLADNDFNSCKSELKMLEAAMHKLPVIVSDVDPYSILINDRVNCLAVDNTPKAWIAAMKEIIGNKEIRHILGEQLHKDVMERYNLATEASKRMKEIRKLCNSKKQLSTV